MVSTIPIQRAAAKLVDLVDDLGPGDEIVLTDQGRHLARIVAEIACQGGRRPGACKGMLQVPDDGDDAALEHFKESPPWTGCWRDKRSFGLCLTNPQLSHTAMAAIMDTGNEAYVSPASHWGTAIKITPGKAFLSEESGPSLSEESGVHAGA